ncbi:MAG: 16S rRNA (adenine(1518)-N(6)/adenine(1519)-N(6))-dimethyltransferase RsmA [Candidatus Omnitrophica bacterium]|nr:16S rRNA (adenine(1518)-N(6)/adenine(1519)-N(6))-dimethyltransferase RsmA [Candidatus Omnitrophota bacterium]
MRLQPKKRLGQNFLTDKNIRNKIIASCGLSSTDVVLEIGSGKGEMTLVIADKSRKVYALELDTRLIPYLKEQFAEYKNIKLIHKDILKFDLNKGIKEKRIKVIGNIPYYISSPIIGHIAKYRNKIDLAFLTVQKEFANRIVAKPGTKDYGSFSCFVQYYFEPEIKFIISRGCFNPVPKVDSAFIRLKVRGSPPVKVKKEERLFKIIRAAFNKRRKTLRNSLQGLMNRDALDAILTENGLDLNVRPERLTLDNFASLANI